MRLRNHSFIMSFEGYLITDSLGNIKNALLPLRQTVLDGSSFEVIYANSFWRKNCTNECTQCDFTSGSETCMRVHIRRHSGEKSYKCSNDHATVYRGHLRTNVKTHTGEISY